MDTYLLTVSALDANSGIQVNTTTHFQVDGDFGAGVYGAGSYGGISE